MRVVSSLLAAAALFAPAIVLGLESSSSSNEAEEARWLVEQAKWGTVSTMMSPPEKEEGPDSLVAFIVPYGQDAGRLFFYLMGGEEPASEVSITLSEASLDPGLFAQAACGGGDAELTDPEDPRCAKLTLAGMMQPCDTSETCELGKNALFAAHPAMEKWPESHGFAVYELVVQDLWMIANFGGGGVIPVSAYTSAEPKHHPSEGFGNLGKTDPTAAVTVSTIDIPDWTKKAERARWVVGSSRWTTVSTISVRLGDNHAWGNIRSIVDGADLLSSSSGMPVFYLPSPDPTNIDVGDNPTIALTFTEAALAERVEDGKVCGGTDVGDPTCAQVLLQGTAVKIQDKHVLKEAQKAFGVRHPLAPWLAEGGAHTGGGYYSIEVTKVTILDYYGGETVVDVDEYLNVWKDKRSDHSFQKEGSTGTIFSVSMLWALVLAFFLGIATSRVFSHLCRTPNDKFYDQVDDLELKAGAMPAEVSVFAN